MRKIDVFGRKVNQAKILYLIIIVFVIVIGAYFAINEIQTNKLEELQAQQELWQSQIDDLLETNQTVSYHEVSQIVQYLPNTYNQLGIINEIGFVKNLSGLALASNYSLSFNESADSPFDDELPDTVMFAKISLSMFIEDPALILEFMDNLLAQDRIYYIDQINVTYTDSGQAMIQMTLYTFYNVVDIS